MATADPAAMFATSTPAAREYVGRRGGASQDDYGKQNGKLVLHEVAHVLPF
jgi:hypothetical protein